MSVINIISNRHNFLVRRLRGAFYGNVGSCDGNRVGDVLVGIDTISGEFFVECEDIEKADGIYGLHDQRNEKRRI